MATRLLTVILCFLAVPAWAAGPDADSYLGSGKFDEGIAALEAHLKQQPKDDVARFGLGSLQFIGAIQRLSQKLAVYGPQTNGIRELEDVIGGAPAPAEPLTYPKLRKIAQEWLDDLARIEATLVKIESNDVKLPLHVGRVPLNLAGGHTQALTLTPLLRQFQIAANGKEADFVIVFDRADVDWLRGYCHLLSAVAEIGLAYDGQELFDVSAHRVFRHVKTPHEFLLEPKRGDRIGGWFGLEDIADAIAAIHMLRFPVAEPNRMPVALAHIKQALALSREMWKHVLAETDDDHEWIPGPKQKGAININVTQLMVDNWMLALDEVEQILQGKKLLPFWRGKLTWGVNLRKVFLEPRPLDIVLWVQGTAATPYLEKGELTKPDTWRQINTAFGGQFMGFGFWFN